MTRGSHVVTGGAGGIGRANNAAIFKDVALHSTPSQPLGSIETDRSAGLLQRVSAAEAERIESEIRRLHPLGRIGSVEEVASVVAFVLSDESGFVSGVVIPVDGGRSALGLDPEAREPD